ncbi:hypothetical protein NP493_1533g00028 [Ridgeia piscesae]|uniref:Fibrinogen C-terminal domain-containing protein n=1 Tax=Ridgeia piscesae TaxID=27915 RepID=A0AAD9NBM3_RIDPI|nr:hypothetical protein NP493_1533g00028 [Ridgeia piscesae]
MKIIKSKTKGTMETNTPIYVNNTQIENVDSYIYMSQVKKQDKDIQREITAGWTAFAKHRDIFKGNFGACLKKQIYNSCILPAMTYGAETWAPTTHAKNKLTAERTNIERTLKRRTAASDCYDLLKDGNTVSGVYEVYVDKAAKYFRVFCDMSTDQGGWIVFQRRQDGSVDFYRDWASYKEGFGDVEGEFWLGGSKI